MGATPQLSFAVLADQRATIVAELGEKVERDAIATLIQADRDLLAGSGSLGWCDVELAKRYKDAVGAQIGKESLEFQRWVIKRASARTVNGLWRVLLTQVWDEALVKRIPILYQRTFDLGTMTGEFESKGTASVVVSGWPRIPEYDVVGLQVGIESVLQLLGREGASAVPTRTQTGVFYRVRWRAK